MGSRGSTGYILELTGSERTLAKLDGAIEARSSAGGYRRLVARALFYRRQYGWLAAFGRATLWVRTRPFIAPLMSRLPRSVVSFAAEPNTALSEAAKQELRRRAKKNLDEFLASGGRLALPSAASPDISILLVLYGQAELTYLCLKSLVDTVAAPVEVILVDNASTDSTPQLLDRLDGAQIIRNERNLHFLLGVNQGAGTARGKALLLLNNDAVLLPGSLAAAYDTLFSAPDIGAVGGKLILWDGTLQEAGSIIWNDGSCAGYGRGWQPDRPECQFRRQVDYCSGAFLLVKRDLFEGVGRFDTAFAPAYYEETDLCMRLREAGYRVIYEPRAEVRHFEFGSAGSSARAIALMQKHQSLFRERHAESLRRQPRPRSPLLFARSIAAARRILVIDDRVPFSSQGSGSPRAAYVLKQLQASGWFVTHYPLTEPFAAWRDIYDEHPAEIEFMLGGGIERFPGFLEDRAGYYDAILISRPHNMARFVEERTRHPGWYRGVGIAYDAEALFAMREVRRLDLAGTPLSDAEIRSRTLDELLLASDADSVITVNEAEAQLFRDAGFGNVHVLGHAMVPQPTEPSWQDREGFLLVGALPADDSPNVDGLFWFVREVMPKLDALIGSNYRVRVAGEPRAPALRRLNHPRVELLGRVEDLTAEYRGARVFLAPTRFAAGVPHKLHEAAARGVPSVATELLGLQLGWNHGLELLLADEPADFAAKAALLYTDERLWERLRDAALARVRQDCHPGHFNAKLSAIIDGIASVRLRPKLVVPN
jgi:GT2 family glycosyltransferase